MYAHYWEIAQKCCKRLTPGSWIDHTPRDGFRVYSRILSSRGRPRPPCRDPRVLLRPPTSSGLNYYRNGPKFTNFIPDLYIGLTTWSVLRSRLDNEISLPICSSWWASASFHSKFKNWAKKKVHAKFEQVHTTYWPQHFFLFKNQMFVVNGKTILRTQLLALLPH